MSTIDKIMNKIDDKLAKARCKIHRIEEVPLSKGDFPNILPKKRNIMWEMNDNVLTVTVDGKKYRPSELKNIKDRQLRVKLRSKMDVVYDTFRKLDCLGI